MEKMDLAIAVVGAAVLVVAIAGSALTGASNATLAYQVTVATSDAKLDPASAPITGSGEHVFTVNVAQANVTDLTFVITVSADQPHLPTDSVKVVVKAPNGTELAPATGSGGPSPTGGDLMTVKVQVHLANAPASGLIAARNAADAVQKAAPPSAGGRGAWIVTVDLTHGAPDPISAHTVKLQPTATVYSATATMDTSRAR